MKRKFLTVAILCGSLCLGSVAQADRIYDLAEKAPSFEPGSVTHGDVYARALFQYLTDHGVEAHLIGFNWGYRAPDEHWASFVVFKDSSGRYWGKQSTGQRAKWVAGTTPQQWTESFYNAEHVAVTSVERNYPAVAVVEMEDQ